MSGASIPILMHTDEFFTDVCKSYYDIFLFALNLQCMHNSNMPDLLIKKIQYTILVFSIVGISETQSLGAYRSLSIRCIAILIEHDDIIYGMTAV
jgi:hypothetical protein